MPDPIVPHDPQSTSCPCPPCALLRRLVPDLEGQAIVKGRADGRWAWVVSNCGEAHELWVLDTTSGARHTVYRTCGEDWLSTADFHPTRPEIVFAVRGMAGGLYRTTWPGGRVERLTGGDDIEPLWVPDGLQVVFYRTRTEAPTGHIMLLDVETRAVKRLTERAGLYVLVGFSEDGKRLQAFEITGGPGTKRQAA